MSDFSWHVEALDSRIHERHETLDSLLLNQFKFRSSLSRNALVHQVPAHMLVDLSHKVQEDGRFKKLLEARLSSSVHSGQGMFKNEALAEGLRKRLNLVRNFVHPDVEVRLTVFHNFNLEQLHHRFNFSRFSVVDQVGQSFHVSDRVHGGNLFLRALGQLGHVMTFFPNIFKDVFDNLLHEHTVVSLGSHA